MYLRARRFTLIFTCLSALVLGGSSLYRYSDLAAATAAHQALPPITVTKSAGLVPAGDGDADPGETIEYTVVVNNGASAATNVVLTDAIQSVTTWNGAVAISPIAVNDSYASTGNVGIAVPDGAADLLANDTNPGGAGTLTIVSPPSTSANGGNVSINTATGAFAYNPPPGFEGSDSFTYTLDNGSGLTDTATVSITVSGMIWFVQNGAPLCSTLAAGCGRLSNPFSSLANFQASNNGGAGGLNPSPNDNIFLYENASAYTGGVTLLAGQRLFGQDSNTGLAALAGVTLPPFSNALPLMNTAAPSTLIQNASGNGVTLGTGNTLNGFTASNSSGFAILGSNFGTVTITDVIMNTSGGGLSLNNGTFAGTGFSSFTSMGGANNVSLTSVAGTVALGGGAMSGATATAFNVSGGTAAITYSGTLGKTAAGDLVLINSHSTGNITLSGNLTCNTPCTGVDATNNTSGTIGFSGAAKALNTGAAAAVNLVSNTGATINFTGGSLVIDTTTGTGFNASGGGIVTVQGAGNTINATNGPANTSSGTALSVVSTTIGAAGLTFQAIHAGNTTAAADPANGIVLNATGSNGGLTVTGNSAGNCGGKADTNTADVRVWTTVAPNAADCTGGVIQNTTGADGTTAGTGIYLNDTQRVSLTRMKLNGHPNYGIQITNATGFTGDNLYITGTNGTNTAFDEGGIWISNLAGTTAAGTNASITNSTIEGAFEHNVWMVNNGTTVLDRITFDNVTIGANALASGDDGIGIEVAGTATTRVTIDNSRFTAAAGDMFNLTVQGANGQSDLILDNTEFRNTHGNIVSGGGGVIINVGESGDLTYNITNNLFRGAKGVGLGISKAFGGGAGNGTASGTIDNNHIGAPGVLGSGSSEGSGLFLNVLGRGNHTALVRNNQIRGYFNYGIYLLVGGSSTATTGLPTHDAAYNVTVQNNNIAEPTNTAVFPQYGIHLRGGTNSPDAYAMCIDIGHDTDATKRNTLDQSGGTVGASTGEDMFLWPRFSTTIRLPNYAGTSTNDAAVVTYLKNRNNNSAATSALVLRQNAAGWAGGAACAQPSIADGIQAEELTAGLDRMAVDDLFFPNLARVTRPNTNGFVAHADETIKSPGRTTDVAGVIPRDAFMAKTVPADAVVRPAFETGVTAAPGTGYLESFSGIFDRLAKIMSPAVHAGPLGAGDVNLGPFSIPANESVTIKFSVTVNNGPYASGLNAITNTANVTADGGVNINSNTTSIPLDAAPDLGVTKTEGGGTTQPGSTLVYTLSYSNTTATNGQDAANVVLTETVPAGTTFNAAASLPSVWSCADGSAAGTSCTINIGALAANANGSATFAVNVPAALAVGATQVSNASSIAENPNVNGTDRVPGNNSGPDTTAIIGNWLGVTSADWNTASNWSNGVVPPAGNNISVPNVVAPPAFAPAITTGTVMIGMLTLNKNLSIGSGAVLSTSGNVALGTSIVDGPGTLELGSASAITRTAPGQVNATLKKNFAMGPLPMFVFPVGTTGQYSPVDVTVASGSGSLSVKANSGTAPATPAFDATRMLQRYWTLEGSGITSDVVFHYLNGPPPAGDIPTTSTESQYHIFRILASGQAIRSAPDGIGIFLDAAADTFTVLGMNNYSNWTAGNPLAPTAANVTVSGRVMDRSGNGVTGAVVAMQDHEGNIIYAMTNPFGYYRFAEVATGQTYFVSVRSKRFDFQPRTVSVNDDLDGLDFVAEP